MKLTIPNDWNGVTLREYQAYHAILKESEGKLSDSTNKEITEFEIKCAIISLFSGADMDELLTLKRYKIEALMSHLGFLSRPITAKLKHRATVNGQRYYFEKRAKKITGGQWITLQHFLQDAEKIDANLHNLLACFAYRETWYRSKKYVGKEHDLTASDMQLLPMTFVKPLTDFFLSDWESSVMSTLRYLEKIGKVLKRSAEKESKRLQRNTGGSTRLTTSVMDNRINGISTLI